VRAYLFHIEPGGLAGETLDLVAQSGDAVSHVLDLEHGLLPLLFNSSPLFALLIHLLLAGVGGSGRAVCLWRSLSRCRSLRLLCRRGTHLLGLELILFLARLHLLLRLC